MAASAPPLSMLTPRWAGFLVKMSAENLAAAHWDRFIYRRLARTWHAIWCRWSPAGELRSKWHAERCFAPLPCEQRDGSDDGCDMRVVYHYGDERGTVRDDAAKCGPWRITAKQSRADGIEHPSSAEMTTLLLPGGPSAWCMKKSAEGKPCAAELFLHHGEHLRMSAGVVHAADGALQTLALIREDARAFLNDDSADLSPPCWSPGTEATPITPAALAAALQEAGVAGRKGEGDRLTATLVQEGLRDVTWASTRVGAAGDGDVVLLCGGGRVAIVAPATRPSGAAFGCGVAWWPAEEEGVAPSLYDRVQLDRRRSPLRGEARVVSPGARSVVKLP